MQFSLREHRLCPRTHSPQPDYRDDAFGNLPDGTLFTEAGDDKLWEKQGDGRVRITAPTESDLAKRQSIQEQREYALRMNQVRTEANKLPVPDLPDPMRISNNMDANRRVEVAYVPGQDEIRKKYETLLRTPVHYRPLPGPLQIMREREELLLAEKARGTNQETLDHLQTMLFRSTEWTDVPVGSFFMTTTKPHEDTMVYLKNGDGHCESICTFNAWQTDLLHAQYERKDVAFKDIQRNGKNGPEPVVVLAALKPEEMQRLIDVHHEELGRHKKDISQTQKDFDAAHIDAINRFWEAQAA